jgi:AcrR family transcriptional regulator
MAINETTERITQAALALFLQAGVKKTSLADVAYHAGVTRITVYRYHGDKRGLVRAVCMRLAAIYQRAAEAGSDDTMRQIDQRLDRLGQDLRCLPQGNLLACIEEIQRLYPDVHEEFRQARQAAIDRIAQQTLKAATREQSLREGLNLEVVKSLFLAAVFGLLENPALISSNISPADVCKTVTEVFRYGILKNPAGATHHAP